MIRHHVASTMEELVNVCTHGAGLAASLVAFPILIFLAASRGDVGVFIGVAIFGVTLIGAYAASTIYHSMPAGPRRDFWRRLDQVAVYLLIAGTYTPFSLGVLRGTLGWTLLAIVWVAAIVGIVVKVGLRAHAPTLETLTYLAMGWLVIVAIDPLLRNIGWAGFMWLLAGGIAYTVGTVFLVCQSRVRYGHCAWHVATLFGSACHTIAVVNYGIGLSS